MTDNVRAVAEALAKDWVIHGLLRQGADAIEQALLASQSSWAKEKAELERQRDEYKAAWEQLSAAKRHASRPVTEDKKHPSHVTRFSDSSFYDEVCIHCGATDNVPGEWGELAKPCPVNAKD